MNDFDKFTRSLSWAAASLLILTVLYFFGFMWLEFYNSDQPQTFALFWRGIPAAAAIAFASFLVRYARWQYLVARAGYHVRMRDGLLAYLAGFAFTASPGKVGELIRCRYFAALGVPIRTAFAAFIYERTMDLLVVLALASIAFWGNAFFSPLLVFVTLILGVLLVVGLWGPSVDRRKTLTQTKLMLSIYDFIVGGVKECRVWINMRSFLVCSLLGIVAWTLICWAFLGLVDLLEIVAPTRLLFSLYPLAMLAGAASMIPGGVGTTEAAVIVILSTSGVPIDSAALAALGIRISTLWFAMACGLLSIFVLESRPNKPAAFS